MIITIDGPSASGKSSVAEEIACQLSIYCMGTGSMYRGLAYVITHILNYHYNEFSEITRDDLEQLLQPDCLHFHFIKNCCAQVYFQQTDLTPYLKSPEISQAASIIATYKIVRDALTHFFRKIVDHKKLVVEGRDIGTVLFPQATIKFFLTADVTIRAQRSYDLLRKTGIVISYDQILKNIQERDKRDSTRNVGPLTIASDAIVINNSYLDFKETVQLFLNHINKMTSKNS